MIMHIISLDICSLYFFNWFSGSSHDFGGSSRDFGGYSRDFGRSSRDFGGYSRDFGGYSRDFGGYSRDFESSPLSCVNSISMFLTFLFVIQFIIKIRKRKV